MSTENLSPSARWDRFYEVAKPHPFGEGFKHGEELLEHLTDLDVLDLGAGSGRLALLMAERGNRVTAVDVSHAAVSAMQSAAEYLNDDGQLTAIQANLAEIDRLEHLVQTPKFDVITSVNVIQFMDRGSVQQMFDFVSDRLDADGEFFIRGPHAEPPKFGGHEYADKGALNQYELTLMLQNSGLRIATYRDIQWPPTEHRLMPQPAYWAVACVDPISFNEDF